MRKIEVYQEEENGKLAIGLHINDHGASLQDLLEAWQPLCDDKTIYKSYASGFHDLCKGCQVNCCNTAYVIPDLVAFKKICKSLALSHEEFIKEYFDPEKAAAGLLRLRPNPCIFLRDNICSIYSLRTLICRFYICSRLTGAAEELIYRLSWTGAAATQVFAEQQGLVEKQPTAAFTSFDLLFCRLLEQYRESEGVSYFLKAASYGDIPLQAFL
jgi:Fe-S-cluster containining protein